MATIMVHLFLSFFFFASAPFIAHAVPIVSYPQAVPSFDVGGLIQLPNEKENCPYTVIITTSCLSAPSTGDHISIVFGDDYGNEVYAPRLDFVAATAPEALFDKCSSDTFQIKGPCTSQICYVYLRRTGPYGWVPEAVEIYAEGSKAVKFDFNKTLPEDTWYGYDFCNNTGSPPPLFPPFTPSIPSPPTPRPQPPPQPSAAPPPPPPFKPSAPPPPTLPPPPPPPHTAPPPPPPYTPSAPPPSPPPPQPSASPYGGASKLVVLGIFVAVLTGAFMVV